MQVFRAVKTCLCNAKLPPLPIEYLRFYSVLGVVGALESVASSLVDRIPLYHQFKLAGIALLLGHQCKVRGAEIPQAPVRVREPTVIRTERLAVRRSLSSCSQYAGQVFNMYLAPVFKAYQDEISLLAGYALGFCDTFESQARLASKWAGKAFRAMHKG